MRECGMLLPIASLPSRYGIGAFSKEAYDFIDKLKAAGQQYWQILPLGPTGFGDSPYQSFSAFAGNPYFIDLEKLTEEGLLTEEECQAVDFGNDDRDIDYGKLYDGRFPLLRKAYGRWKCRLTGRDWVPEETQGSAADAAGAAMGPEDGAADAARVVVDPEYSAADAAGDGDAVHGLAARTLGDETREYCFYMAVKDFFDSKSWNLWDEDIRLRKPEAVAAYRERLSDEIGFYEFLQIKF